MEGLQAITAMHSETLQDPVRHAQGYKPTHTSPSD